MSIVADPTTAAGPQRADRSAISLAVLLANAAERLRTDPPENLCHCAVRGAAAVLRARLDERMDLSPGAARHPTEGP